MTSQLSVRASNYFRNASETHLRLIALMLIIAVLIIGFASFNPAFLGLSNLMNIIRQTSVLAIISIGMTYVILSKGLDLSVGSNLAFAGAASAIVFNFTGSSFLAILCALIAGGFIGFLNGLMIGKYKISPFMATLATMALARGLALSITGAASIRVSDPIINWLGQSSFGPIPVVIVPLIILFLFFNHVLNKTVFGRNTFAVGGNINAAKASGIKTERQVMLVYLLCGFMVSIGTIVTIGRLGSAQPWAGLGLEFEVITAVVLGGTSLMGGEGSLRGTFLGAVLVGILANGLSLMQLAPYIQYIVKGLMIIAAVLLDEVGRKYSAVLRTDKGLGEARLEDSTSTKNSADNKDSSDNVNKNINKADIMPHEGIAIRNISKFFPGVRALSNVSFDINRGSVHALVGENGAGKSTLVKILAGVYKGDQGNIYIDGKLADIDSPQKAQELGVSVIYQEFSLVNELSVAQNIFLGKEEQGAGNVLLAQKLMNKKAKELLDQLDMEIDVRAHIKSLSVGEQQMVEIAKALNSDAWAILMDEPTSALTVSDKERLFNIIEKLKEKNISVVYISHRMPEIFEVCDTVTVLRDGQHIGTHPIKEIDESTVIRMMVGRDIGDIFTREKAKIGQTVLEVKGLTRKGVFEDISFSVSEGEVLGLSGLMGAGRTEIVRCIFGLDRYNSGEILIGGEKIDISHPMDAIAAGLGLVPEDRRRDGFVSRMNVKENLSLASLQWINNMGLISKETENEISKLYIETLSIRTPSEYQNACYLSGGNQQKVCLGKWLARNPRLLILDEPTRGIDVGAKAEIHKLIEMLAKDGIAILMISSELPEIIGVADNIVVLHEGKMKGYFSSAEATQEKIMFSAMENDREIS